MPARIRAACTCAVSCQVGSCIRELELKEGGETHFMYRCINAIIARPMYTERMSLDVSERS